MKDSILQLTLRQMQGEFSQPITWVILIGVGVVLAFAGAFGTDAVLRPFPLALYWIGIVSVTYMAGSFVSFMCQSWWSHWNKWLRIGVSGLIIGLTVFAVIAGLNRAIFGPIYDDAADIFLFFGIVLVVTSVVNLLLNLIFDATTPNETAGPTKTPLLDRVPFDKRGALVAISVEDHYVRIRTTKGETMVLLRLSDAIKETPPTAGMQVHRSHWVATDAITAVTRSGNGAVVSLTDGADIPVSRSNIPTLKSMNLL